MSRSCLSRCAGQSARRAFQPLSSSDTRDGVNEAGVGPVAVADVIDTNGAGDAWAAGFLYGHLRGWPLPAAGNLASLIGAETVMHMGPIIPDTHWQVLHPRAMALGPKK